MRHALMPQSRVFEANAATCPGLTVVGSDRLSLSGGDAQRITFPLGRRVRSVDNTAGRQGGIATMALTAEDRRLDENART